MTWKGKKWRMDGLNINEQRIVKTLLTTDYIDVTKPFQAKEALQAIKLQREDDGKKCGHGNAQQIPSKLHSQEMPSV